MSRRIISILLFVFMFVMTITAQTIKGKVLDENGDAIAGATVVIEGTQRGVSTNTEGKFKLSNISQKDEATLIISFVGYESKRQRVKITSHENFIQITLNPNANLSEVEVFGERYKQPEKLEAITRMPLRPSEQIQSISVISDKVIAEQGVLTIADAMRNVPGVTLFGSYGGVKESMSSRGFRGIPVLKNGVRMDSQFQTASGIADLQGAESIQMIKGSAAITQGVITDIGNAGGVINVVTKTPKFINAGQVDLRIGSWGQVRPTFDVQSVLNESKTVAFRLNGAYERSDNYRPVVNSNRVYINPSLEWRPDDITSITVEGDYLNSNVTPVTSTVNFGPMSEEKLYDMPHNKFLGFKNDNNNTKMSSYSARINRKLTDVLSLRAAYFYSSYNVDETSTSLANYGEDKNGDGKVVEGDGEYIYEKRTRSLSRSWRDDKNSTFQIDLIGQDLYTGNVKHTFQVGFDYRVANAVTKNSASMSLIDTINVTSPNIPNNLIASTVPNQENTLPAKSYYTTYGIMAQEVMTINKYVKAILGLRYSYISSINATAANRTNPQGKEDMGPTPGDAWDPSVGIMITPLKDFNIFASYTTSTSLRSAANPLIDGTKAGASKTKQFEAGIKSDWLDNRLRFNFTYFHIFTDNLTNPEYIAGTDKTTGLYYKAGDLKRDGFEVELNGRILSNLQVMLGYAYLNARYDDSPSYVNGSAPMNAPKHTANGWAYYTVEKGPIAGLSIGLGAYYVGKRPVNEYSLTPDGHGNMGGKKPFDMPAYTTVNAQLAYTYSKVTARLFFNNIFDALGYNSYYRGGYINQIDPRNFAGSISYRF